MDASELLVGERTAADAPGSEVSAADRVLQVLAVLACAGRPLSANELMQGTGLPRSSLYRQLARLKRFGFVADSGALYAPGPLGLQLARGFDDGSHLVHVARPVLVQLSQQTQESAGLLVAANGQAVCLDMVESPLSLRCSFDKGSSVPLKVGASAKCVLAYLPAVQREALLNQHYGEGSPARAEAAAELQELRTQGYITTVGQVDAGVWGCSVPVFASGRRAVAALSLMAPHQRVQHQQAQLVQATLAAAARISRSLAG
ncbi:IclR family transcriptional regulator [Comamonas sp.]|uniref:IclR family transcriptional regulator n=1 Tax=Comamonas sp. TaxID=34028 RepID=UPI0028979FD3|nr:IclR family transcriptional regulator [Comamonas sp.]